MIYSMDKLKKNIELIVANKALKDIHKIVKEDEVKEKHEKRLAKIVAGLILIVIVLVVLKNV